MTEKLDDYRLRIGRDEYVPIVVGGMGVDISTNRLAAEACRLGGIGHISDAMVPFVSDRNFGTAYTRQKSEANACCRSSLNKAGVKFDLGCLREAQSRHVAEALALKTGTGAIFINVMEKLTMGSAHETLRTRLEAALGAGIDGITLSAGLHQQSMPVIAAHPRASDAKIGIVVSGVRSLKIFLRSAHRAGRLPDYIVLEGPLAGGHLGFGTDWESFRLASLLQEIVLYLKENALDIPVIAAGGIFSGADALAVMQGGASGVQVATRFAVTSEAGLPDDVKQRYFAADEKDVVVSGVSPTGYLIRMLRSSPCLDSKVSPNCGAFGYLLNDEGKCQYLEAFGKAMSNKLPVVKEKTCLCYHFSKCSCYTCGYNVFHLKETAVKREDGSYALPSAEEVFLDYQFQNGINTLRAAA